MLRDSFHRLQLFVNHLCNISPHEWGRVLSAWSVKFVLQTATILGFTLMTAFFVEQRGIENLPVLFIWQALFVIGGTLLLSTALQRISNQILFSLGAVAGCGAVVTAFVMGDTTSVFFWGLLLVTFSGILAQLNILLALFVEELFTPLESERTFPLVESAEPLGTLVAGLLAAGGVLIFDVGAYDLLLVWAVCFAILLPLFFVLRRQLSVIPMARDHTNTEHGMSKMEECRQGLKYMRKIPFLKGLVIIVFLHSVAFHLVEFEFTKAIEQRYVSHETLGMEYAEGSGAVGATPAWLPSNEEENLKIWSIQHGAWNMERGEVQDSHDDLRFTLQDPRSTLHDSGFTSYDSRSMPHSLHESHSAADALTHGLGRFHILISVVFLCSQLFLASRILRRFGVVKSILTFPVTVLIPVVWSVFQVSFVGAVSVKGLFEVFGGVKRTAYHASFYALRPKVRERAKELLEGIVRPLGMLVGTLLLLGLQRVFDLEWEDMMIFGVLAIVFGMMLIEVCKLGKKYTFLVKKNLETPGSAPEKMDAIEILSQHGHDNASQYLIKSLLFRREKPVVQIRILRALGNVQDPMAIPEILHMLSSDHREVRLAAVEALGQYRSLATDPKTETFSQYRVREVLQQLFESSDSKRMKRAIMRVFRVLHHADMVPFLVRGLESGDVELRSDVISVCGMFHDASVAHYLEKFLDDTHPRLKSNAIIALWQFVPYRLKLLMHLNQMLQSDDLDHLLSAIYVIGETCMVQEIPRLEGLLSHEHESVRRHASVALVKMGQHVALDHAVDFVLHDDRETARKSFDMLKNLHPHHHKSFHRHLRHRTCAHIHSLFAQADTHVLEEMDDGMLRALSDAYEILGEDREMMEIGEILEKRGGGQ